MDDLDSSKKKRRRRRIVTVGDPIPTISGSRASSLTGGTTGRPVLLLLIVLSTLSLLLASSITKLAPPVAHAFQPVRPLRFPAQQRQQHAYRSGRCWLRQTRILLVPTTPPPTTTTRSHESTTQLGQSKENGPETNLEQVEDVLSSAVLEVNDSRDNVGNESNIIGSSTATPSSSSLLSSQWLVQEADATLSKQDAAAAAASVSKVAVVVVSSLEKEVSGGHEAEDKDDDDAAAASSPLNRRLFMASALIGTGVVVAGGVQQFSSGSSSSNRGGQDKTVQQNNYNMRPYTSKLAWEVTPVNKRTGVTVFDAEKAGYNVRFVTYLSRFLLCFDVDCQRWWYTRAADIPRRATAEQVEKIRLQQFGAFSASVEVGLQEYRGSDGPAQLMDSLLTRYCRPIEAVRELRAQRGLSPLSEQDEQLEKREILEARRQVALLFGLMEANQPVEAITKVLAAIDNGSVKKVSIESGGSGYALGYGPPLVEFPPPEAGGPNFVRATGRATLSPNGLVLRMDCVNRGYGYTKPPIVTVTAPGADRGVTIPGAVAAQGQAFVFKKGPNKGRVQQIVVTNPGKGYVEGEEIRITLTPPELEPQNGGVTATARTIMEYAVSSIQITNPGTGYAVEKPILIYVEPPPLTARLNMNDPLNARILTPDQPLPAISRMTPEQRKKLPDPTDPSSFVATIDLLARNGGKGGGGGCIGRACYDQPVVAYGLAEAETSSFSTFRKEGDGMKPVKVEEALMRKSRFVSATTSGFEGAAKPSPYWTGGGVSSSSQLLTLLPEGIGLEYDTTLNQFVLAAGSNFDDLNERGMKGLSSTRAFEPDFGPRGRSPIERDVQLDFSSYIRFCLSGAICCSGVHLALTPIDVIKTKVQTDPQKYPTALVAFQKLVDESGGLGGFFQGWVPTFVGFFCWGGFSYSFTEFLRRYLIETAASDAMKLEVPIILAASAIGSFFGAFILAPFEAVRIRSVAQPEYGSNALEVTNRMVKVCVYDFSFCMVSTVLVPKPLKSQNYYYLLFR
jgi:hypothetical protein